MTEYDPASYGDRIADVYDDGFLTRPDPGPAVGVLADLAGDAGALELGIGTGRVALPLARRGIRVSGIEASEAMVARLRSKPGGDTIPVAVGDFADVGIHGEFSLIFAVFNTFFALPSQEEQVRCFRNVADHLADGGVFVIEAFVPSSVRFPQGQNTAVTLADTERIILSAVRRDPVRQRILTKYVVIDEGAIRTYPVEFRYAWPAELDLMAELAGLRLRKRWANWRRMPFRASSTKHVSIYERRDAR